MPNAAQTLWILFAVGVLSVGIVVVALGAVMILAQRKRLAMQAAFSRRLLQAQEEERARIAREVHDDVLQRVAMIRHEVGDLAARLPPSAAASAHQADAIGAELMDLGVTLRAVAHRLHPSLVETVGLAAALEALAGELRRTAGLEVAFSRPPEEVPLKPDVGLAAYRIAQEALRNVLKHAGTARAELEMAVTPTSVVVRVKDQGAGLPPDGHREHGLGLRSMRERAELARGRLNVTSRPGQGTTVEAVLPREEASGTP